MRDAFTVSATNSAVEELPTYVAEGSAEQLEAVNEWTAQVDDAVTEVFEMMLSSSCAVVNQPPNLDCSIAAKVVFTGNLDGRCLIRVPCQAANRITSTLLGSDGEWDTKMIDDAVGELCNMIAGGWKSKLGEAAATCSLSVPAISRGLPDELATWDGATRRFYAFNDSVLEVTMTLRDEGDCDEGLPRAS